MATGMVKESLLSVYAAPHNSLIFLEPWRAAARLNGLPQLLCGSSRDEQPKVEFLNHLEAVSVLPIRGGNADAASGLGSS
jgi:hypothetical protein